MLSCENPSADPSERSKLNSDEGASDDNQRTIDVDLSKSGLEYHDPLPKFSIRDYVFNTRGKDLENHWPFSKKSLELCLKHRVENVLPPYQSLSSTRSHSIVVNADKKLEDYSLEFSELGKVQNSERISVLLAKNSLLESQAEYKPENPELAVSTAAERVKINIPNPLKKCRLRVKLSCTAESKTKGESPGNSSMVLEAMASKVCPVCKTFSSSSNTTLNAHIDQCLSVEPTNKWISNSKATKHNIRPRKARLMVDVYATSKQCTLEDLEKRNGRLRAAFSGQLLEDSSEDKNRVFSPVDVENDAIDERLHKVNNKSSINCVDENEDAVYFDSSGTKVRILSKLNDLREKSSLKDDTESRKLVNKRERSFPCKKNLHTTQRRKLLQRPSRRSYSSVPTSSLKAWNIDEEESNDKEEENDNVLRRSKACDQMKCDGSTTMKILEKRNQHEWKITKTRSALLGCSSTMKATDSRLPLSKRNKCSFGSQEEYSELPRLRKRTKMCVSGTLDSHAKKCHVSANKDLVQKKFRSSLVGSVNESSAKRRLLSHEKQYADCSVSSIVLREKRTRPCYSTGSEEEEMVIRSPFKEHDNLLEKTVINAAPVSSKEVERASEFNVRKRTDICKERVDGTSYSPNAVKKAEVQHLIVQKPTSKTYHEEKSDVSHKLANSRLPELVIPIDTQMVTHFHEEMNGFVEQSKYFDNVDPIPIPGPPGSYLPSPGHVCSEEPLGNSSLTTCRIHSSEDEHELGNTESAESPISGTSFLSNSITAKTNPSLSRAYRIGREVEASAIRRLEPNSSSHDLLLAGLNSSSFNNFPYLENKITEQSVPLTYLEPQPQIASREEPKEWYNFRELSLYSNANETYSCSSDPKFSSSSAVLRLMGKNLTVVKKAESFENVLFNSSTQGRISSHHRAFRCPVSDPNQVCELRQHIDSYPYGHSGFNTDFGAQQQFQAARNSMSFSYNTNGSMIRQDNPVLSNGVLCGTKEQLGIFSAATQSGYGYKHVNRNLDYSASSSYLHKNTQKARDQVHP